jgi:hypothetical protein
MKYLIAFFVVSGLIFSCKNTSDGNQAAETKNDSSIIFGNKDYAFPQLSPPAKDQATHWGVMEDFLSEAKNINGNNYETLRNRSERLKEYTDSLFKKIPDTLDTRPIHSRLLVLKTRSELLYQAAHQSSIDSSKVQNAMENLNVAVKNLIVQLNEKFQKDNIDAQRRKDEENELKKQRSFTDSVYKAELEDKTK